MNLLEYFKSNIKSLESSISSLQWNLDNALEEEKKVRKRIEELREMKSYRKAELAMNQAKVAELESREADRAAEGSK